MRQTKTTGSSNRGFPSTGRMASPMQANRSRLGTSNGPMTMVLGRRRLSEAYHDGGASQQTLAMDLATVA
jgi:hypothetical protein